MVSFFYNASIPVMALMVVLIAMSVVSWGIIIKKSVLFLQLDKRFRGFETAFWSGVDLSVFHQQIKQKKGNCPVESIFMAGFSGLTSHKADSQNAEQRLDQCRALMQLSQKKWEVGMHGQLTWLGTIASVSPYVGLLGTVFGVMHTFQGILLSKSQAQLHAVAPGISEALGMTAFGLFVAIPATVAYNRLSLKMATLLEHYQIFQDEFLVLMRKHNI